MGSESFSTWRLKVEPIPRRVKRNLPSLSTSVLRPRPVAFDSTRITAGETGFPRTSTSRPKMLPDGVSLVAETPPSRDVLLPPESASLFGEVPVSASAPCR